jgi:hypothetical protein
MVNTKKISKEEIWMKSYFKELKDSGFIKEIIYQPDPIVLFYEVKVPIQIRLQTKIKTVEKVLLKKRIYTPDFLITWNGDNIFHKSISDDYFDNSLPLFFSHMNRSFVEIKSDSKFDNNTTRFFLSRTQPWIWEKYQIFVNLIKVPDIFKNSFIPQDILPEFYYKRNTKKNKVGDKKFSWNYNNLKKFINE